MSGFPATGVSEESWQCVGRMEPPGVCVYMKDVLWVSMPQGLAEPLASLFCSWHVSLGSREDMWHGGALHMSELRKQPVASDST